MLPNEADQKNMARALEQLTHAIEELFLSGLTTASEATRQAVVAATQEAARFRLLRLGATLRVTNEELGRYIGQDCNFNRKRLTFFLGRAWLLSRGLRHSLEVGDVKEFDRLNWTPNSQPSSKLEMACMGVVKRVSQGAFAAFDFRFRTISDSEQIKAGQAISLSFVFPYKPGVDIIAEGFLHLPQKQKFSPTVFLEGKQVAVENANIVLEGSVFRLNLSEQSMVTVGGKFEQWSDYLHWSPESAMARIISHKPSPLDLETELQEELVLDEYEIGECEESDTPGQSIYPIRSGKLTVYAVVGISEEKTVKKQIEELRKLKKKRPVLFGLMHYERCRPTFQLLSVFRPAPQYVTISPEVVNKALLLKSLSFK